MERKNSILIVDDDRANLLYLNHLLGTEYQIYLIRDAKEAIERAEEYLPDLIMLDIIMPDMSGYDVLAELKKSDNTKSIPVVFITGLSDSEDETRGLGIGAEDYIIKPFIDDIVRLRIRNQIKIVNQMRVLDKRLKQQKLMTSVAQGFLTGEHVDTLYTKTLKVIGEFMEIPQILLFRLNADKKELICENEWIDPARGLGTRIGSKLMLKGPVLSVLDSFGLNGELCLSSNDPQIRAAMEPYRVSFQNYIVTPIFIKGEVRAVLDFSKDGEENEWIDSELNLACLLASIFSGVFEREAIESDLNTVLKLKAELISEKERAEHSSRVKSEFLSRMSHEMYTPMNAIIGMANLAQATDDPQKRDKYLKNVDSASRDLMQLIDDVLDVSDIEERKFSFTPLEFDFTDFLKKIFKGTASYFSKKNQLFETTVDPAIPNLIISDEKRLAQAFLHLLTNAAKFTGENGVVRFKASVQSIEKKVLTMRIEVADNGIGISDEQQKRLFVAFEQVDGGMKRKHGGSGLGLYITKNIAEMLGGGIQVESEPGKGAKFTFVFKAQIP